jgi:hypothetical protein
MCAVVWTMIMWMLLSRHLSHVLQVYTFGPTFRAENSNTSRHLAEFWVWLEVTLTVWILHIYQNNQSPSFPLFRFSVPFWQSVEYNSFREFWSNDIVSADDRTRAGICWFKGWHGMCYCLSPVCCMLHSPRLFGAWLEKVNFWFQS